jgi:hypothetical protein
MTVIDMSVRAGVVPDRFTVTVAVPVTPPDTAVMVVVPSPTAVAMPLEFMVATLAALETHCT